MNLSFAKKFSISFKNARGSKFDLRYAFIAILVCILLLDIWVIQSAVGVVLNLQNEQPPVVPNHMGVRVNFQDYRSDLQRIQQAASFQPTGGITQNPFFSTSTPH